MNKLVLVLGILAPLFVFTACASHGVTGGVASRGSGSGSVSGFGRDAKLSDGRPPCLSIRDGDFGIEVDTMVMKIHNETGVHSLLLSDGPPIVCKSLALVQGAQSSSVKIVFQMPNRKTDKLDEMVGVASLANAMWTTLPRVVAVRIPRVKGPAQPSQVLKKQKANSVHGDGL